MAGHYLCPIYKSEGRYRPNLIYLIIGLYILLLYSLMLHTVNNAVSGQRDNRSQTHHIFLLDNGINLLSFRYVDLNTQVIDIRVPCMCI